MDKIEAVDKARVRITTKTPDAPFLSKLSGDPMMVLAPEVVERAGKFATVDTVVGTGAFIMKSAQEGVGAEYVRNPDYWKPGLPYLDGARTRHFEFDELAYAAFQAGEVDICLLPGTQVKDYVARQGKDYVPDWYKDQGFQIAQPNTKRKPFDDVRVTKALRLLMDHEEFIKAWAEVWFGRGRNGSVFAPALDEWDLTHEEYYQFLEWKQPKDEAVREALALLNAAGFNRDNVLRFDLTGQQPGSFGEALTVLLQAQWKRLSQGIVDASVKIFAPPTDIAIRNNRQFDYFVGGGSGSLPEPDAFLSQMFYTGGSRNYSGYSDPQLDAMIDKQRAIMNVPQRKAFVREILLYLIDRSPSVVPALRFFLTRCIRRFKVTQRSSLWQVLSMRASGSTRRSRLNLRWP